LKEYLTVLTDNDLLSYDQETHSFKTTQTGLRFLEIYNQIGDVMENTTSLGAEGGSHRERKK
jgi:predicted transcriptional regulator